MAKEVIWRYRAVNNLQKTFNYLSEEWGDIVAERFLELIRENVDLLLGHPELGRRTSKKGKRRKRVIKPRTSIIYEITDSGIAILDIWDNRRKPKR